jgi:hypothetical protein
MPGPPKPRVTIGRTWASRSSLRRTTSQMTASSSPVSGGARPIARAERTIRAMWSRGRNSPPSNTRIPSNTPSPYMKP